MKTEYDLSVEAEERYNANAERQLESYLKSLE